MREVERIADQLARAFDGDAWHGTPLMRLLDGITPEAASRRPIPGAHSVWELVLHIEAWMVVVRRRLEGEACDLSAEEDWRPAGDASEGAWRRAMEQLQAAHAGLQRAMSRLRDDQLAERVAGQSYSAYHMLHGVVQHTLYHAGQIGILRKAEAGAPHLTST